MMKFFSILFVLFALNGCSRADLISDLLNSLQQQQPNLNQLTGDLSGLSQFLQQNGNTLTSLAQLLQQQQQSGTSLSSLTNLLQLLQNGGSLASFEQQLNQLSQLGQQTLNSLPFSVTNLTNILSNINWDQFLANVTAQFNALSQLNSAQGIEQSLAQFQALLNSTGLGTILNQILSSSQFSALTNLLPSINQTVLMQFLNQTNQLTNIITLFANGSYEQAIPQLFQFLNITPYLDQINNVAQQLLNYQNISNDFNATQIQFATLSAIFQAYTNMTAQQIFLGLLQQDNVTLACLTSIATNQAAYDACAMFTNQTAYTALLATLKAFNVTIDGVAASFSQLFIDVQAYVNSISNAISSFNVTDMYNRAIAALTSFFSPNIFITNPPASTTTTTTTASTRTTTNSATSFVYHYPLFSLLLPSLITVSTWAFYF